MEQVHPNEVGLCDERLGRVTAWLEQQVSRERLAGCSMMIARRGRIAYIAAAGLQDVDQARPFSEDTLVRIFSMTKPVTTVAAMMLYERGLFQLDAPVADFLPEFVDTPV